ncbi:MAG: type I methionyl aminopeptidase [Patescibacteria group bacterium]
MSLVTKPKDLEALKKSGRILAQTLQAVAPLVVPGVTTLELDKAVAKMIKQAKAKPAFLGYQGYPKVLCASVNDEVVHTIPSDRVLKEGDIIGLDLGVSVDGMITDAAITVMVGKVKPEVQRLVEMTKISLDKGIEMIRPDNRIGDISHAIEQTLAPFGYGIVHALVGHGVGYALHEDPRIPNYGRAGTGLSLKPGMVLAVEPMINLGEPDVLFGDDGWRVTTADGSWSAHFEHTILVTQNGHEVLTRI